MPLIRVKDKETGETTEVSQDWLDRWPDDFDVLPEEQQAPGTAAAAAAVEAPAPAPDEQRRRSSF